MYLSYHRNYGIKVSIAPFHNIFGPQGTWNGGKEKAPAANCPKVAAAENGDAIDIWGTGKQTRSFLYVVECIKGVRKLMEPPFTGPINIGSEEMISINDFAKMVIEISGKDLSLHHVEFPIGVIGRNSDNRLIEQLLQWKPKSKLLDGVHTTYKWINKQLKIKPNQDILDT